MSHKQQRAQDLDSSQMTAASNVLRPRPADPSMQARVQSPTHANRTAPILPPSQEVFTFSAPLHSNSIPPPGARPPMIQRRASRFDPMETTPEEDGYDPTPRHPLRRIREDPQQAPPERQERSDSVSLPGIKALLNAADQPPLMSPFGGSFFGKPTPSSTSPLDSPTSRTSRFSSLTSSTPDSQGWWAPDDRSSGFSRTSSFSVQGGEPDFKRRRSDLAPIPPDADETARLKWQAQSRNASYPATLAGSAGSGGGGLRSMLYPPPTMRGSISGTPLTSPMSPDSPFDHHASSRGSPMTGPLSRKFADLHAGERSPPSEASTPLRARSPTDRRPSMFPRLSNESVPSAAPHHSAAEPGQRLSLTRPPSPEPTQVPRRSSLAEQIMVKSGDVAMAQSGRLFTPDLPHDRDVPYIGRRESTESILSTNSATFVNHLIAEPESMVPVRDRRSALVAPITSGARRPSFGLVSEDEPETKGDPGMRGMEVLAESARRVAESERKDSMDEDQPAGSPAKPSGGSTGPKYPCQYCKKALTRPSSLRIHTYSHTGERPYVCPDPSCGRKFSVQSNLKRHAKVHHQNNQQHNAAMGSHHPRQHPPPGPHSMMGRGPQPGVFGYSGHPHPGHGPPMPPPHPHMVPHPSHHPPPPGYGPPPPPGYMPGPGFAMHPGPPPGHYRGPMRPNEHGPPSGPFHIDQRRHSHEVGQGQGPPRPGPQSGPGVGDNEWETEEEEDELDDDV